jgi:hypothetical protein
MVGWWEVSREQTRADEKTGPAPDTIALLFAAAAAVTILNIGKGLAPYIVATLIILAFGLLLKRVVKHPSTTSATGRNLPSASATSVLPTPQPQDVAVAPHSRSATTPQDATQPWDSIMPLYSFRKSFFNRTELAFYRSLKQAVSDRYSVFAKVRLLDLCTIPQNSVYSAMNRVSKKHVDFLLCDPSTFEPVAAIEVDGPSHQRADRVERDAFVDDFFDQIDLPLIRVAAAYWFEPADLSRRIAHAIAENARPLSDARVGAAN